nr:FAD-binding protein [Nitrosomonas nitrosa]
MLHPRKRFLTRRSLLLAVAASGAVGFSAYRSTIAARRSDVRYVSLEQLRETLDGDLVLPIDPSYEASRRPLSFNPSTDRRPVAIAYCVNSDDVMRALDFASGADLPVSVRSGGCDVMGRSVCEDGLVIDISLINHVASTANERTVMIGAGATAGLINADLAQSGEMVPLGCDPMVGVGGLTLGGGLGWVLGRHGAACDNLISAQVVTASGQVVLASDAVNPDLFWALKGGGGNFGIVTEMEFRTHDLLSVIGGYIVFPSEQASDFLQAYPGLMARAPRELMVELALIHTARGVMLVAMTCYCGSPQSAERALAPFRGFGVPLADDVGAREYRFVGDPAPQMIELFPAPTPPEVSPESGPPDSFNHWRGCNLTEISQSAADGIVSAMADAPLGASFGLGHFMHGASVEISADRSSLPRHPGSISVYASAAWAYHEEAETSMHWVNSAIDVLASDTSIPTYINYLAPAGPDEVAAAYGVAHLRLSTLKSAWDPENNFRHNNNILPRQPAVRR